MTASARVQVSYINQPKAGKKNGSIKTADNQIYGVPPHMLGQFQQGGTYQIEYEGHEFQGNYYKTVQKVTPIAAPASSGGSVVPFSRQTDEKTALRIFVCGIVNAGIESGQVNPRDEATLSDVVQVAKSVWASSGLGNQPVNVSAESPKPALSQEMNDSIPW